jgi:hypothetical protein
VGWKPIWKPTKTISGACSGTVTQARRP